MAYNRRRLSFTLVAIFLLVLLTVLIDWHATSLDGSRELLRVPNWVPGASWWNGFNFHLGLDLKGGTHLVYQADTSKIEAGDRESAVEGVRDVIERRVNAFGVAEPVVQTNKDQFGNYRIIVELAGVKDVNQAIKMIGETPLLEFKELNPNYNENFQLTEEQQKELEAYNQQAKQKAEEVNQLALSGEDFASLAKKYSEDEGSRDKGGDLGWVARGVFVPEFDKVIFDELKPGEITTHPIKTQFGYHIIKKVDERQSRSSQNGEEQREVRVSHILIKTKTAEEIAGKTGSANQWKNTKLSGKYLKKAVVTYDNNTGDPEVSLEFNSEGAKLFEEITARNVGKPLAIFLDGQVISAPTVNEKITGGKAVITGRFNLKEAKTLVQRLNAGALPVPINLISQQTVGPTLGRESVTKSLRAGLYGLLAVALFMIIVYRLPGVLSVVALLIYTLIVLAIFKLIPVTLTLAGIAGFLLSIGIAVDANVLIFERFKEEIRNGRAFVGAVEEGFKRAWTSIRDSNFSTLITCIILYWFGTSVIRGFAVTLAIGVLVSMFSAIIVTRSFLRVLNIKKVDKWAWLLGARKKNN